MAMLQMDLFSFAVMQATIRKPAEEPKKIILKNFRNERKIWMQTTAASRIEDNLAAIRRLKQADLQNLCESEKFVLAGFTGWGGLTEVFMEGNSHYEELKSMLTPEEYETAAASMLDSYYTPENLKNVLPDIEALRQELENSGATAEN